MKIVVFTLLFTGLFLNVSSAYRDHSFYQVVTSHPHELEELKSHIETVYQNGRLHVVQLKSNAPLHVKEHLRLLEGGEKSYLFQSVYKSSRQLRIKDQFKLLVDTFDKEAMKRDVYDLSSFETRAVGTIQNMEAVELAKQRLEDFGYEVKKICYSPNTCSVVADKKGSALPEKVLMVMAHIDSVGEQFAGADDNASGTAVLLEMARILKTFPNRRTIRFFISNGEERGLLGAAHYARLLANENKIKQLDLVINMDMVGYNSNGVVELETNPEYEEMARWYAELASRYTKLKSKITLGAWGSDHVVFLRRGVPSVLTIENWDTKTPCYHQECDRPETLNYEYAAEIGKLNTAAIINKDQS
jgi:Peptidase family M28